MATNRLHSKMHLKMWGRFLLFILCLKRTVCLASSSSTPSHLPFDENQSTPHRVVSLNKYGGAVKNFDFLTKDDASKHGKRAIWSSVRNPRSIITNINRKLVPALRTTFLPIGFPEKTPPGYFQFCIWSWVQDVSTQLRSVLATQKILEGVGVGRADATAISALFNYLIRDGCGMAANLFFTYAASSRFRTDVKRWRLFADMSVDIGITLEVAATLFPKSFFLPCICLGNMFKAICGVAAGACGGSINLYWAKGSDISDINAKFGAQNTVSGAIGIVFAGLFAKSVNQIAPKGLWLMYFFLTYLHLFGNVMCMRIISFDYLNTVRLGMILRNCTTGNNEWLTQLPSPRDIAKHEPLWFTVPALERILTRRKALPPIHFGVAYDEFCKRSWKSVESLKSEIIKIGIRSKDGCETDQIDDGYIISTGHQTFPRSSKNEISKSCIVVSFLRNVSPKQQIRAYVHAWLLASILQERCVKGQKAIDLNDQLEIEAKAKTQLESLWGQFQQSCSDAGWDLSKSELQTLGYEIEVA